MVRELGKSVRRLAPAALVLFCVLAVSGVVAEEAGSGAPAAVGDGDSPSLLESILVASGVDDPGERGALREAFRSRFESIRARVGERAPALKRARRLHAALHDHLFGRYRADADGIDGVLDRGEYNCVSATLLYGLVAREMGYEAYVVETPRHLFLRLEVEGEMLDVETTSPDGFDLRRELRRFQRFALAYKYATPAELRVRGASALYDEFLEVGTVVSLEQAVAFLWQNRAERALQAGDAVQAAEAFLQEHRTHPGLIYRSEGVRVSLVRAFLMEYDTGRFDAALDIALIDLEIFPGRTTGRDRLLAAARKRIDRDISEGRLDRAEELLRRLRERGVARIDLDRLDREVCPLMAAEAVRLEDWAAAQRMAERYIEVEPDGVESTRLLAWIQLRREQSAVLTPEGLCLDLRALDLYAGP